MSISPKELEKLNGYRFGLKEYKLSHSEMTLFAVNPNDTAIKYAVFFAAVYYIQMPIGWTGSFEIGSDSEREEVARKCGFLRLTGLENSVKLYKSNSDQVLILGALMGIEPRKSI